MSSVYLAKHKISQQLRAIKVLPRKKVTDKSYLDRFYLEARAAASLNHPNVVRIYDICNEKNTHYMVMEFAQGNDLYNLVSADGAIEFKQAAQYIAQAALGLEHAHQRALVHRDIKPANLLRTDKGDIKILDLGLALVNQDDSESLTVLHNEKVMGTADYLSPEQAVNSHKVDCRADIYSLGCTLYYLLTGHPPFPKGTLAQRIAMHQSKEPADIRESRPGCPDALIDVCQKMMKKDPQDRYQTCAEIKSVLDELVDSGALDEVKTSALESAARLTQATPDELATAADHNPFDVGPLEITTNPKSSKITSSKKSTNSNKEMSKSNPTLKRGRRRKAPPRWVLPALIVFMFVLLVVVLTVAFSLIKKNQASFSQPHLHHYFQPDIVSEITTHRFNIESPKPSLKKGFMTRMNIKATST